MSDVDALAWVMESDGAAGDEVEVHQVWGDLVVDVRQVPAAGRVVLGSTVAWRWRLLGVDMGGIPASAARVLPWVLPLWSDVVAGSGTDFIVPSDDLPGGEDHVLVEGGSVRIAPGFAGFVDQDGERRAFADADGAVATPDGGWTVPLRPGTRAVVEVAGQVFHLRRSAQERRAPARLYADPGALGLAAVACAALAAVLSLPEAPVRTATQLDDDPPPVEMIAMLPPPAPVAAPKPTASGGRSEATPQRKASRESGRPRSDREVAGSAGLLSSSLEALGGPGLSAELRTGIGGLIGARGGPRGGTLGQRGGGLGGTGQAEGGPELGLSGPGRGGNGPGGPGKAEGTLSLPREEILVVNIDRSAIDEVIKRNLSAIRYCYQRELQRSPGLGGKVVVKFTIGADGKVTSAGTKTSTLGNAAAEACIVRRFQGMTFPAPRGGGVALVSYPFLFSAD